MGLPTKDDFNTGNDLDGTTACEHFYNKTLDEAEALFRDNSLTYCQDLMWMGGEAFNFYLEAAINYLRSPESNGDNDIVNCLLSVIEYRSKDKEFSSAIPSVRTLIDYVIKNYSKFEVDTTIYGDLLAKYHALQHEL